MPDPGDNIDKAKQKAVDNLKAKIEQMNDLAYTVVTTALENNFDFKAGKVEQNRNFIKQLNKLSVQILDLLQTTPKFTGPVSSFIKDLQPIYDEISSFQKTINGITVPALDTVRTIVVTEVIDQLLNNGLNSGFVQPLRDLIYQNFTSGLSLKDAKVQIKDFIAGGKDVTGKLERYIDQTAQQAVDSYSGMINKKLLEQFKYDTLLVTGTLIDTSSPQCRFVINDLDRRVTKENFDELKKIGLKHGFLKTTTFESLPIDLDHWGCRHGFYPYISKKVA